MVKMTKNTNLIFSTVSLLTLRMLDKSQVGDETGGTLI